jgi:hypothetical protein
VTLAEFLNLLLLERGLTLSDVLITISQPQPGLRHVGEGDPRFPLSKRARRFQRIFSRAADTRLLYSILSPSIGDIDSARR